MPALSIAGVVFAWAGSGLILMSEGSRGLAAGLAVLAVGLGLVVGIAIQPGAALVLAAGGLCSAGLRLKEERGGWGLLPSGTSSRIVLFLLAIAASLYLVTAILPGPATEPRAAALGAGVVAGIRLLGTPHRTVALAAAAALALSAGSLGSAQSVAALLPAVTGGFVALLSGWIPGSESERGGSGA